MSDPIDTDTIDAGCSWSRVLRRGQRLRLVDRQGGGNCSMLFFHARQPLERYNMPDTLKAQHTALLTAGRCLFSDMGRVLIAIVADDCGWHDPLGAVSSAAQVAARFGERCYQEARNDRLRNGRDNLLVELGKHGLGRRDWHAPVNFFSKVIVDEVGGMIFHRDHSPAGASVELRAELDVLCVATALPHPLDPTATWQPRPIDCQLFAGEPAAADDPCRHSRPECGRAYALTEAAALAY